MANESELEVYRALRTGQERYIYFLLAAAGAAIAFVINQTQSTTIAWSQVLLAVATLCWGASFFFGCRHLGYVNSILYANAELIRVQTGRHPQIGEHPQKIRAAAEGILEGIETNSQRASGLAHLQFRLFIAGGLMYVCWHVLKMYLRSI
jgi:hypothetical protein